MTKKIIFSLLFLGASTLLTAQISGEKQMQDYVNLILQEKNFKGVLFSLKLVNCETGKTIFEYKPELKMVPASIQKVITTGIGVVSLGKDYTFKTTVYYDGIISPDSVLTGNLYITGGGDPSFGSKNFPGTNPETIFKLITYKLKNAGVNKIDGRIIVDDSYFDGNYSTSETVHPSWEWEDLGSYYGSGVHGLNFHENAFPAKISTKNSPNINISLEYPYTNVVMPEVISDIKIISKDSSATVMSFSSPAADRYIIRGKAPLDKDIVLDCALQNPAEVFEFWLRNYLNYNGISASAGISAVAGATALPDTVAKEKFLIMEIKSPPFYKLAEYANYISNNLFADAFFKNISKEKTGDASFSKSSENITGLLKTLKINTQNIRIIDGSGLSRHNLLTADFMCDYLRAIKRQIPDFHSLLPSPGTEKSTLRFFMSSYPNNNKTRVFLKSGSMTGVLNYAGYIVNKNGETMCVAILMNNFLCTTKELRPKLEKLVYLISEL
jgi:D-alanyl-D-alanine carboxypeptidase/D-alanyl-D-alanine-endopeptidase (penicillin-binding protein 4)